MTYREVLEAGRDAYWDGEGERFVHLASGITYWDSPKPGRKTYSCSLPVADRPFPADGWYHRQGCDCAWCASRSAAATSQVKESPVAPTARDG